MNDKKLLHEYVSEGSEQAFAELVERYADTVYSVCLNRLQDPAHAQDAAQAVFTALAHKAKTVLGKGGKTSWWLIKASQYACLKMIHRENLRRKREKEAADMRNRLSVSGNEWKHIAPHLDEALVRLSEKDRSAVILRYFKGMSFVEVGSTLNISKNTAVQRVRHGLKKLRKFFSGKGISMPAAGIMNIITENGIHTAPSGFSRSCVSEACNAGSRRIAASETVDALSRSIIRFMVWVKIRPVLLWAGALAVTICAASLIVVQLNRKEFQNGNVQGRSHTLPDQDQSGIAWRDYRVIRKGSWEVDCNRQGVIARQTDRNAQTSFIYFGRPVYTQGVLKGEFRINSVDNNDVEPAMDLCDIGICFFYPKVKGEPYSACDIGRFKKKPGVWYDFTVKFRIRDNKNTVEYTSAEMLDNTAGKERIWKTSVFDRHSLGILKRETCGIGLSTRRGVTAEWRCLRLAEAE